MPLRARSSCMASDEKKFNMRCQNALGFTLSLSSTGQCPGVFSNRRGQVLISLMVPLRKGFLGSLRYHRDGRRMFAFGVGEIEVVCGVTIFSMHLHGGHRGRQSADRARAVHSRARRTTDPSPRLSVPCGPVALRATPRSRPNRSAT